MMLIKKEIDVQAALCVQELLKEMNIWQEPVILTILII